MSLTVKAEDSIPSLAVGLYPAVCCAVVELGTQDVEYMGVMKKRQQVVLCFEIKDERIQFTQDGVSYDLPLLMSKTFTMSLGSQSKLRKELNTWRGKDLSEDEALGFDLRRLLGANCQLSVLQSDKGKSYIDAILTPVKGLPKLIAERALTSYEIEEGLNFPKNLPKFISEKILASKEIRELQEKVHGGASSNTSDYTDDMPF